MIPSWLLSLTAWSFFFIPVAEGATPTPLLPKITFDHLEGDTLVFSSSAPPGVPLSPPPRLKTGLYDLSYIGSLQSNAGGLPYFLIDAKPCETCQDERKIYVVRPNGVKPTSFVYPGKVFEPKSHALLLESRAFFGECLPRKGDSYVVFQKEKIDRRRSLQNSVFIAEAGKDYFDETLLERHLPPIATTLKLVKKKSCHEIPGRNRLMLSKPLDIHPHSPIQEESEEKDEIPSNNKDL